MENAPFALTWKGFSLKNDDGSVRISTERDIEVSEIDSRKKHQCIQDGENLAYGIRISMNGEPVMETDDNR